MVNFAHLHVHCSMGSMQDAMANVYELFEKAKSLGQRSMAITDHGTMAGVLDARKASQKTGVKYIPGLEAYFVNSIKNRKEQKKREKRKHLVLLAKNETGYRNLLRLNYEGFANWEYVAILGKVFPVIDWDLIERHSEGLICLTACGSGPLASEMFKVNDDGIWDKDVCHTNTVMVASRFKSIFGKDFYLEVQPHDLQKFSVNRKTGEVEKDINGQSLVAVDQTYTNRKLLEISMELDIPIVATCDVHYIEKEDAKIHDMLMAINEKKPLSDPNRHRYEVEEFYVKSGNEVYDYFSKLFDADTAQMLCDNSVEISDKCDNSTYIGSSEIRFPIFDVKSAQDYNDFVEWKSKQKFNGEVPLDHAYMRYKCVMAFKEKFGSKKFSSDIKNIYKQRMIDEIKIYEMKNFSSYMLITSDFISEAKKYGIRVGPGRGSVGGSFVAYLLKIHDVDPIEYGLLFERFLNAEKTAFPDIDSDFSPDGRDWVEKFVIDKYGHKRVAHVSNLSTITPKVVIKDIARSLELGGSKGTAFKIANAITDVVPADAKTLEEAVAGSKDLAKYCEQYKELEIYGKKLIGLEKVYSTHAAGVVISDVDLDTYAPLRYDKNGTLSLQYEKNRCEDEGLIKMDFLGLEHLKVIDATIKNAKLLGMDCPEPEDMNLNDQGVWDMISKGHTICVFQMGSDHMRSLCKRIKPKNIEDLSLVNALGRPSAGEKGKDGSPPPRDIYIRRRDGKEKVSFRFDCLKEPLKDTLGVCVYEEQLAKLARHVAGWDLKKADGLRKLTKLKGKNPELAARLEMDFIEDGANHTGLAKSDIDYIWKYIVEPFAGYGFNKAHGIFYSINGYHTAYYKHHYPAAFMAAALKSEVEKSSSDDNKIKIYKKEASRLGIKIVAPDVNKSGEYFTVLDDKTIVMGLAAVKGVGIKAVQNIIETRQEHEFVSFSDFLYRTNSRVVRKDVIQALAKAGCFDSFRVTRKYAFDQFSNIRTKSNNIMKKSADTGANSWDVFGTSSLDNKSVATNKDGYIDQRLEEWDKKDILKFEAETLGEYISGGLHDIHKGFFTGNGAVLFSQIKKMADGTPVRIEAVIDSIKEDKTKSGKSPGSLYGTCSLLDKNNNSSSMKIWPEHWKRLKNKIAIGKPVRAMCRINVYKGQRTLVLNKLEAVG
jgi:DNA polymerase-3 subunit alpha